MLVPILAGAVLGGLLCMVARRRRAPGEMRILAVGLAVGWAGFAGIAWLGLRGSAWWLDQAQSIRGARYPFSCVGLDLVLAGFVL